MLMQALSALRETGIDVRLDEPDPASADRSLDADLTVTSPQVEERFVVKVKQRAPYPNELPQLDPAREAARQAGAHPLLVVPFVTEPLGAALTEAGWSWADGQGNFDLRAPGLLLRQRRTTTPPKPRRTGLPGGSGSLAIVRALIRHRPDDEELGASALAGLAGVSQPRASQVLTQLQRLDLVDRRRRGWAPDRAALLDRFLAEYRGPGGSARHLYSLDPVTDVAVRAASTGRPRDVVVSADVGPDLLAPWRRPSVAILYTVRPVDERSLGLVEAQGADHANVIVRAPADRSVFRDPPLLVEVGGVEVALADESQLIWDLHDLGGTDRLEAAGRLREWLLHP
ncbi:MAG TPA: hypothetical protein VIL36_02690 [Acidimicrobiales bacterium]